MSEEKIACEICKDHFVKLATGDVCVVCPSRVENEAVVKAMSEALEKDGDGPTRAMLGELRSVRMTLVQTVDAVNKLKDKVFGNGKLGLTERLTVLETKLEAATSHRSEFIAIGTAIVSALLALFALMK